ncbi:N-formylglutamate amidohydrolase [Erythrobacter sp. HKB08]|uniref:N-formylglutamate amidohydrolase n=1 Tax=Erythrobacter sp. HKB08 TaxID=2502843 RepID=UPI001008DA22|nr:N-formylglutamate amidohydrolase [Erythrobacter sp. HKB08]
MTTRKGKSADSQSHRGGSIPGTRKPAYTLSVPEDFPVPIVVAAPHAGRSYPDELWKSMRRPQWSALRLEDRFVDRIAAAVAADTGAALLVAQAPRAMIDLNRASDDVDWTMVSEGAPTGATSGKSNRRARSGLGLVPRRLPGLGEIWNRPLAGAELDARIGQVHAPYHKALDAVLQRCRDEWGAALLLDLHSMPPLKRGHPQDIPARYVVGDRFGASADDRLVASTLRHLSESSAVSHNRPYAGGYVLDRHSARTKGIHAIQVEICRALYLDEDFAEPTQGVQHVAEVLSGLVRRLAQDVSQLGKADDLPLAAE